MSLGTAALADLVPDRHLRQIRNIQFNTYDLAPLVSHGQNHLKIPSTTINVFGALMQQAQEPADFLIFSSWLGLLVRGLVKNLRPIGSFQEHVTTVVSLCSRHPSDSCLSMFIP